MSAQSSSAILQAPSLRGLLPGLVHGFTSELGYTHPPVEAAERAFHPLQRLLQERLGLAFPVPVELEQPHGTGILSCQGHPPAQAGDPPWRGYDGASSDTAAGALLLVRSADCVPVLAVHPGLGAYAALHAGWRGTAEGILPRLLKSWQAQRGEPAQVQLVLGPAIGPCCFEVREDCLAHFAPRHLSGTLQKRGGRTCLDLPGVLKAQAQELGVPVEQIEALPPCTCCHGGTGAQNFASYRRSSKAGQPTAGRNLSFVGMAPPGSPWLPLAPPGSEKALKRL